MLGTTNRIVVQERLATSVGNVPAALEAPAAPLSEAAVGPKPALVVVLLRAAIGITLAAFVTLLMMLGLLPVLLVALVALLPALAPLILVGVGILGTAELKDPDRICDPDQPCCCGRHGIEEALQGRVAQALAHR